MTSISIECLSGGGRTVINSFVRAGRGDHLAVGRPRKADDDIAVTFVDGDVFAGITGIPHLDVIVTTSDGEVFAVWRPGHQLHHIGWAGVGGDLHTGEGVPYLDAIIT